MKVITAPNEIILDHHAVIEASAGTGKTYTITHLVLRYLLEQRLPINRILLVTFTDKATSELKARIHEGISGQLADEKTSGADKVLLQQALSDLHLASIHTIHGFCQRVLKEYAFEQGSVLDKTLVDDNTVYIKQLQMLKRTWPAVSDIAVKLKKTEKSMQQLDDLLIGLAKQSKAEDVFYPKPPVESPTQVIDALLQYEAPESAVLKEALYALNGLSKRKKPHRWKKLSSALQIIRELKDTSPADIQEATLSELLKIFKGVLSDDELTEVTDQCAGVEQKFFLEHFQTIKTLLNSYQMALLAENQQFIIEMVHNLRARVKQHKVSQGQISYDDMITDLADALASESESEEQPLTQRLRDKYQVALIDEFQDTDAQQWSIFQWLFTASEEAHQLVLIGDPKQSIYGFRGANIHTYAAAKEYLMDSKRKGLGYRLSTNFRSLPDLTVKLNQFFTYDSDEHPCWYEAEEVEVSSPTLAQRTEIGGPLLLRDDSGLSAFNSITVDGTGLLVDGLKKKFAAQIARLIQQKLLGQVEFKRKTVNKTLDAGDVCVLVRNKKDAKPIEQALETLNIPHSFYKKTDLYQSEAAIQIQLVLTALAFPQVKKQVNNAWLSLFFGLSAEHIKRLNHHQGLIGIDADLSACLTVWLKLKELSGQRDWVAVFTTLFEETGTVQRLYANGNWRMLSNLQQIKQELLQASLDQKPDAYGMLHLLLSLRSSQLISQGDWQQKDTELPAVQIMTIHSSKGLEYPVVFLFGGFSAPSQNRQFCKYHDPSIPAQVFDLANKNAKLYQLETEAENKRLYYVAMTRAVYKLFVPVYQSTNYQTKRGDVFYQDQVVDRLIDSGLASPVLPLAAGSEINRQGKGFSINLTPAPAIPELPSALFNKSRIIHSFSSLQKNSHDNSTHFGSMSQPEPVQADDLNTEMSMITDNLQSSDYPSIPGGAQTGNVLHGIFENLDFSRVLKFKNLKDFQKDQAVIEVVESQMKEFLMPDGELLDGAGQLRSTYSKEFAVWVWHTLNKPIQALSGMRLCELERVNRRHEMSFYWSQEGHVLTGFIDLLFKVNRKGGDEYFILDWKSNYSANGYEPIVLSEEVMKVHNYHDQYRWYALAIKAWFNSLKLDNAQLTGALYLFSRGIDSDENNQNGIFYQDLNTEEFSLKNLKAQLIDEIESTKPALKGGER